jgi:hypothetical protein
LNLIMAAPSINKRAQCSMCERGKTGSRGAATFAREIAGIGVRATAQESRPARAPAAPHAGALRVLLQRSRYAGEGGIEVGPERLHDGNDGDGNARGAQAIFNRGRSGLVLLKANKKSRHGESPCASERGSLNVRFASKATELLGRRKMTLRTK